MEPKFAGQRGQGLPMHDSRKAAKAARQARRHRGFAGVMMVVLGVACVGLLGTFALRSGMLPDGSSERPPDQAVADVSKKSIKMLEPKITGFDRKAQSYVLTATSARQDDENPAIVELEKVIADLKLKKSGDKVRITADKGIYNGDDETLRLDGNIRVRTAKGYAADLVVADVFLKKGRIVSDQPVTVAMPSGYVQANGVELWNDGENIRFVNRARMVLNREKKGAG